MQNVNALIASIVRKHHITETHNLFNDCIQAGHIAVHKYKRQYRKSKGQFTTFIYHHIRKAVQNYIASNLCEVSYDVYETMLKNKVGEVKLNKRVDPDKIHYLPNYLHIDFVNPYTLLCLKEKEEALNKVKSLLKRLSKEERMVIGLTVLRQNTRYTPKQQQIIKNYAKRKGWSKSEDNCLNYHKYKVLQKLKGMLNE